MHTHFVLPQQSYKRDIDILKTWIEDMTFYLHRSTGRSMDDCFEYIQKETTNGKFKMSNPRTMYLERKDCDREKRTCSLSEYLDYIIETESIVAPTLTVYRPKRIKESLLAKYVLKNLQIRKTYKKEMFISKMRGDSLDYELKNRMQSSYKNKNNSLSGAHASEGTVLANHSAHPTLTSTCRVASGYGNLNNEKFLMGNRHYWSPIITLANVIHLTRIGSTDAIKAAMDQFEIHYPTAEQAMECVLYSSRLYWNNKGEEDTIFNYLNKCTPLELAAFVYNSDLYMLAKYNEPLVRDFFKCMITEPTVIVSDAKEALKTLSSDIVILACCMCPDILGGKSLNDLGDSNSKYYNLSNYSIVISTGVHIQSCLDKYAVLIKGLWISLAAPHSVMHVPSMRRRAVLVSDTDSTIFTNQYWTKFYTGKDDWSKESNNVAYVTTFLASQTIVHILAMMSANIGADADNINRISMKNEYFFPLFATTSMSKHYYAYISAREGNVYSKYELEIKGKNLRDSTVSININEKFKQFVTNIMDTIIANGNLNICTIINSVLEIEQSIKTSISSGNTEYLSSTKINTEATYKIPESSNYRYYTLWTQVFAPKYGNAPEPPYTSVKLSLITINKSKLAKWVREIEDRPLAERLALWLSTNDVSTLTMILLPPDAISKHGIPKELSAVIKYRGIIYNSCVSFYMVLESLGLYCVDGGNDRILSDVYPTFI